MPLEPSRGLAASFKINCQLGRAWVFGMLGRLSLGCIGYCVKPAGLEPTSSFQFNCKIRGKRLGGNCLTDTVWLPIYMLINCKF